VVSLVVDEDLRLVLEATEGVRVDDAVAVALERRAVGVLGLEKASAEGTFARRCPGREPEPLPLLPERSEEPFRAISHP
jgi:hypothetical protein